MCGCPHHKAGPLLIVLIGVTFLLGALGYITANAVAVTWPILLILLGGMKLSRGMCGCCK